MIKKYKDFIKEEIGLSLPDLSKPSPDGLRGDTLVKKIENDEPFEIEGGEDKAILDDDVVSDITDKSGNYSPDKAEINLKKGRKYKEDAFKEKGGKFRKFKLNQLSKTGEFGSTKGSSAGSKITREQESIQTFLLAYTSQTGNFPESDQLESIIGEEVDSPKYSEFYKVEKLTNDLTNIKTYYESWKWTTESLINEFESPTLYKYHQIGSKSELIELIKDVYTKCCKKSFGKTINISKWNPSDIWVVHKESENKVINFIKRIDTSDDTSLVKLNNLMNSLFERGYLFGISLKKISNSPNVRKKLIINGEANRPVYKLKNSDAIDFSLNNKTIVLYVDKFLESDMKPIGSEKITISNNSSGYANINIEVTSISSRQGKCNLNTINNFLETKGANYTIEPYSNLKDLSIDEQDDILNNAINNLGDDLFRKKNLESNKDLKESDIISRIQAMTLCEILYDDIEIGNIILNNILLYALSIEWSFGDGEETKICPKYFRVIEYYG
jgi:hypothetical protein